MKIMFLLKVVQQVILETFTRTICEVSWAEVDSFKNWIPIHSIPDCNPMDYFFWNNLQELVQSDRAEQFSNVNELKRAISRCWRPAQDIMIIRQTIDQFHPRLRQVVDSDGDAIKQNFEQTDE